MNYHYIDEFTAAAVLRAQLHGYETRSLRQSPPTTQVIKYRPEERVVATRSSDNTDRSVASGSRKRRSD